MMIDGTQPWDKSTYNLEQPIKYSAVADVARVFMLFGPAVGRLAGISIIIFALRLARGRIEVG